MYNNLIFDEKEVMSVQQKFTIKRNTIKKTSAAKKTRSDSTSSSITRKSLSDELHINIITSSYVDTTNSHRLRSPIDAEGTRNRRRRRATKSLTLKSAPPIPTAPKDPAERRRRWIATQIKTHIALVDIRVVLFSLGLALMGLLAVFSSTKSFESYKFVIVQLAGLSMGVFCAAIMSVIDYRSIEPSYRYIIGFNVILLLLTYLLGSGVTDETNANWIDLGFIKIQPSEFAKLMFVFSFAVHLASVRDKMHKLTTVLTLGVHAGIIFLLMLLQKDLGSLTIFFVIFICMCFSAGLSIWYYIAGSALVLAASPFIWAKLSYYQQNRIMLCFDPTIDPNGVRFRYQQKISRTAIGSGGVTGAGYLNGAVTQTELLPAKHTDMIFSTICEEFGLIGACIVLAVTFFLVYRIFKIGVLCGNTTGRYICVGVGSMLMIQVVENVGMCLGIMPVIGITYPFLSYGGSSILSCFIAIGMVLSVSTHGEKTFFG